MKQEELLKKLDDLGIPFSAIEHPAVRTVDEAMQYWQALDGVHTKNLFFRDAKKQYWLVSMPIEREIEIKSLHGKIGSKRLSFASADRLDEVLKLLPGSVSPLAVINDEECQVNLVLDQEMMSAVQVNFHPLTNTSTIGMRPADLEKFLKDVDYPYQIVDLS